MKKNNLLDYDKSHNFEIKCNETVQYNLNAEISAFELLKYHNEKCNNTNNYERRI